MNMYVYMFNIYFNTLLTIFMKSTVKCKKRLVQWNDHMVQHTIFVTFSLVNNRLFFC